MIFAVIVLACAVLAQVGAVALALRQMDRERAAWAVERKQLVDRAIARHTGEIVALDRTPRAPSPRTEPVLVEGLT